jgi:WD40 repeat protein
MPPELRMIDLGRLKQIGQSLKLDGISAAGLHVSPFGDAIAALDGKADKPTVKVWTFDGKEPRTIVLDDSKVPVEAIDFASQGKLLTVKNIRKVKEVIFHRLWEVWDISTGKRVSSFQYPLEYSSRWVGFSPARYYLAMEHSTNDGYHFLIWDLTSGKLAGKLEVQPRSEGFGIPGGITFSPDGKEAALLWSQGGDGMIAKIHRFDIEKGVKKGAHILREEFKPAAVGFGVGGMTTIQFLPDGRGWLISGFQIAERETGKFVRRVGPAPGTKNSVHDRRFADPYHVTTLGDKKFAEKKLSIIALPKAELDAEFKNAASK